MAEEQWNAFVAAWKRTPFPTVPDKLRYQLGDISAFAKARAFCLSVAIIKSSNTGAEAIRIRRNALQWARIEVAEYAQNIIGEMLVEQVELNLLSRREAVTFFQTRVPGILAILTD